VNEAEQAECRELQVKRDALLENKREHELKLLAIKNAIRTNGRMSGGTYQQYCSSQLSHVRALQFIDNQLRPLKARMKELNDADYNRRQGNGDAPLVVDAPSSLVAELSVLREHYQKFAADGTRISSMRQMAAEFALKLDGIIKRAINPPAP